MPETLKSLQVKPEDVEKTYSPRHQNLEEWGMIMRHIRQDRKGVGALAAELGIERTRDEARYNQLHGELKRWGNGKVQPRSVRAICALHEIGIFPADALAPGQTATDRLIDDDVLPFTYDNRLFPIVSLLSSIQYWYGSLMISNSGQPCLQLNRKQVDPAVMQLTEGLLQRSPRCTDFQLFLDAIHARFLQALGTAAGRKTAAPLVLPHPIELALNTLAETNKTDRTEIDLARASVRDFICSLFYTGKVTHTKSRGYSMTMPSSNDPVIAAARSNLLLRSFREARIPCEIHVQATSQASGPDARLHSAIFHLREIDGFDVERFATEIRGRIQEVLPLNSALARPWRENLLHLQIS